MHIAVANFWLLSVTGPKPPEGFKPESEKQITSKAEVIDWLKRSFEIVKAERARSLLYNRPDYENTWLVSDGGCVPPRAASAGQLLV
jgi:hypothetical protein